MISDIFKYVWQGFLHYINILFGLLDFRDLGFMWIILIGIFIISIFNKKVRNSILGLIHVNDTIRMYKKGKIKMYKIVHDISPRVHSFVILWSEDWR